MRDSKNQFMAIVEEKDASSDERKIKEVNDGLYIFNQTWLRKNISKLIKSAISKEYYLTDLLKIAVKQKQKVSIYKLPDSSEWQGINTPEQLLEAEQKMIKRLNEKI